MNLLRKFVGSENQTILVSLPLGVVRLVRPAGSPQGTCELLFPRAELALVARDDKLTSLSIKPLVHEDESDDPEPWCLDVLALERSYTLRPELKLAYYSQQDKTIVTWIDPDGESKDRIEFVCDPLVTADLLEKFDSLARKAQYWIKYGTDATTESQLSEFDFDKEVISTFLDASAREEPSNSQDQEGTSNIDGFYPKPKCNGKLFDSCDVQLYKFDPSTKSVVLVAESAQYRIVEVKEFEYVLEVSIGEDALYGTLLDTEEQITIYPGCISFNCLMGPHSMDTVLLKFMDLGEFDRAHSELSRARWQSLNKRNLEKVSATDRSYLEECFQQMDLDDEEYSQEQSEGNVESGPAHEDDNDDESGSDDDDGTDDSAESKTLRNTSRSSKFSERVSFEELEKNSFLEVSNVNDRSYVVRGNKIGVFKTGENLEYVATIDQITDSSNSVLVPKKIMLHERDRRLILQGKADSKRIYSMDLEYGKVVDEWELPGSINDFGPSFKGAKAGPEAKFLALSNKSLFNLDPRQQESVIAGTKTYAPSARGSFNTIATNEDGSIVTGASDGVLRFYNKFGLNAKMSLPGMGDPIIGVDSSADGRYIVATCATYLLVIDGSDQDKNLFNIRLSEALKPKPIRLQIDPASARQMYHESGKTISFTPAKFDYGNAAGEKTIVTSTGRYVVVWSLKDVFAGKKLPLIRRYSEDVAADNFKYGSDKHVVVALEDDVQIVKRSLLKRASKPNLP